MFSIVYVAPDVNVISAGLSPPTATVFDISDMQILAHLKSSSVL